MNKYGNIFSLKYKKWLNINSKEGKCLFKNYLQDMLGGSSISKSNDMKIEWNEYEYTEQYHEEGQLNRMINEYLSNIGGITKLPANDISFDLKQSLLEKYLGNLKIAKYTEKKWDWIVLENLPDGHCFYRTVLRGLYDLYDILDEKLKEKIGIFNPNEQESDESWDAITKLRMITLEYIEKHGFHSVSLELMKSRIQNGIDSSNNKAGVGYDDYVDSIEIEYVKKAINQFDNTICFLIWNPAVSKIINKEKIITPPSWDQSIVDNECNKFIMMINSGGFHYDTLVPKKIVNKLFEIEVEEEDEDGNVILQTYYIHNEIVKDVNGKVVGKYLGGDEIELDEDEEEDHGSKSEEDHGSKSEEEHHGSRSGSMSGSRSGSMSRIKSEEEIAYENLLKKMDTKLFEALREFKHNKRKTEHWAWWAWPNETKGLSEPKPKTFLTYETGNMLLNNAPLYWKLLLIDICKELKKKNFILDKIIPEKDWNRIEDFVIFWENITKKRKKGWKDNVLKDQDDLIDFILPTFRDTFQKKNSKKLEQMGFSKKNIDKIFQIHQDKIKLEDILNILVKESSTESPKKKKTKFD